MAAEWPEIRWNALEVKSALVEHFVPSDRCTIKEIPSPTRVVVAIAYAYSV